MLRGDNRPGLDPWGVTLIGTTLQFHIQNESGEAPLIGAPVQLN
jgi:hypothetical protein